MQVILTRPAAQGAAFAHALKTRFPDISVLNAPLMVPDYPAFDVPDRPYSHVIFTSLSAAHALRRRPDMSAKLPKTAFCVGPATGRAVAELGFSVTVAQGDAQSLIALIAAQNPAGPLLHLHGMQTRGNVAGQLCAQGIHTDGVVVYHQMAQALSPEARLILMGQKPVILPVFSPRSAEILSAELAQCDVQAPLYAVAISNAAAQKIISNAVIKIGVADHPDEKSMIEAIARL